ncbi:hypothetical protein [Streptomyces pseudovenezuelae]|uniref:hypothetical protein n=1 Tax=Streptomyces pseudovenezuelae TaxID=67350 RepID=UPI0036EBE8A2
MSILTIAPAAGGFSADKLDELAGRADAYDDEPTLTLDELIIRAHWIADLHPNLAYAQGYNAYVKGVQRQQELVSGRLDTAR